MSNHFNERGMRMGMEDYRIDENKGLELGIYTLGDHLPNPHTDEHKPAGERLQEIIELAKLADQAGLDFFSVGESHQDYFVTQAHTVVLSAIAQATENIKIGSSSTIISTLDPVRVYEDFATLDLISNGRAEIIAGRASRVGLFDLLGYDLKDYEELYEEKFDLLNLINQEEVVNWEGSYRAGLKDAKILPRPKDGSLPIWRAVGGTTDSAIKAGYAGVPMYMAHLGGSVSRFKQMAEAYRGALEEAGYHSPDFPVATAGFLYVADSSQEAMKEYYPHLDSGMRKTNGVGFSKRAFKQAEDKRSIINVGSPQQIIEKILYQHEQFGNQRFTGQLDFGGVPFDKQMKNIELIGNEILPAIRKYTQK